ncbi:MAG: translocation/assembly module TamB domain-containing protein [Ignavibacteriales bacterium]|nr:translocation/assembly module TamB domain-containing protein [Ignavibacteriales bacterium]
MKQFLRTTYYAAVITLFLVIALAGFTQTKTFRSYLRSTSIAELNSILNGTINFGDIKGNLVTGFDLSNLIMSRDGREVFTAERLEARYDLPSLLFGRISVSHLTVVRPRIHLWRAADGHWNVDGLFRSDGQSDSASSPLTVHLHLVELLEGSLQLTDSTDLLPPADPHAFHYTDVALNPFSLRARFQRDSEEMSLVIYALGFESSRPSFRLEELSGDFRLSRHSTEAHNLRIRTRGSRLSLSAALRGADITALTDIGELEKALVDVDLSVDRLDFAEFKQFLPGPVDFLNRYAAFDVKAAGPFGNLTVKSVAVKTPRTYLNIRGTIGNLHHPSDLTLNLEADDNIIHPADLPELVPGLNLPDLTRFGILNCSLKFDGTPEKFRAAVIGSLEAGNFVAEGDLDFGVSVPVYACTLTTRNFDLAGLLDDPAFSSALNTRMTVVGSGTTLETMTSVIRLQTDSSTFSGLPVHNSILVADIAERGLRTNLLLQAEPTRIDLHARARLSAEDSIQYEIQGTVNSLDLATILKEEQFDTDLSFHVKASGDLAYAQSDIEIRFLRSAFGPHRFEDRTLALSYHGSDSLGRTMTLHSDPLDLRVDGLFTPLSAVVIFEYAGRTLADAVAHRIATLDSLRTGVPSFRRQFAATGPSLRDPISARVSAEFKDVYPLGILIGEPLYGSTTFAASVEGTIEDLSLAGSLILKNFSFAGSTALDVSDADLSFSLDHLRGKQTIPSLESEILLNARRVMLDSTLFTDVSFRHQLREDTSSLVFNALVDSTIGVTLDGASVFVPNRIDLTLPRLRLLVADHLFDNLDTIRVQYGRDGLRFESFILQHEAEEIVLQGMLDPAGISDLRFSVQNFLLNNLQEFSRNPSYVEKVRAFNGVLNGEGVFIGNLRKPEFEVSFKAHGVTIGETVFGQVTGKGGYRNGTADVLLDFRSRPNDPSASPELFVSGTMPVALGTDTRAEAGKTMDLTLHSRGFRLEFLDPFVPVTSGLKGSLTGDIVMRGTLSRPLYEGSLRIEDAEFLFVPLGVRYRLHGNLVPEARILKLVDLRLTNLPEDRVPALLDGLGSMNVSGNLTLEGIEVKAFDIRATGQLLVMKETARLPTLPFYGNIYVASGANPLRWQGTPERSFVAGDLLIKNATITFPPVRDVFLERSHLLTVEFIDDTSSTIGLREEGGKSLAMVDGREPTMRPNRPSAGNGSSAAETTFLDNIIYNLTIETAGLTQVRFVFNQLTNEELFADLKGRLVFLKNDDDERVTGELEVGPRSYYRYFKTLSATGKLLFTGDLSNPELSIVASHEGTYRPPDTTLAERRVVVRLDITGSRDEPKVKMGLDTYDLEGNKLPARADPQSDAIAFLVGGTFKDDMTQGQQRNLVTTSLLGSIGSSLLSGPLTDLVRNQVGYITSIDVYYYGGSSRSFGESADIRLTGEIGDAVIRLGGRVFEDIGNTNVSIQFPMSSITGSEAWRNLILEIERRSGTLERFEQRRPSTGVHLLYRITF